MSRLRTFRFRARLGRLLTQIRSFQRDLDRLLPRRDVIPFVWRSEGKRQKPPEAQQP